MWCNTQVTFSPTPDNARSESELETDPRNPLNVVGASKRFIHPSTYDFTLAAYASFDGGESWTEASPLALLSDPDPRVRWTGISDPVLAWDDAGGCYLVALPFPAPGGPETLGIAIYKSSDGGRTWSAPNFIHPNTASVDDKQWAASDRNSSSPHYGNVYIAWDKGPELAFARTTNRGATWTGAGTQPVGASLAFDSFAPSIAVGDDGSVNIFWIAVDTIKFVRSTDGGNTFSAPQVVASGLTTLTAGLGSGASFPKFPGGSFRVLTLPSACAGAGQVLLVAWADYRDGISRIYCRRSTDGGATWLGPASGEALLPWYLASGPDQQDFHPQLASRPGGEIACAFYEFGPKWSGGPRWIHVILATSQDGGASFTTRETVTNVPWDPQVDAPFSHGDPSTTFIGDYFGLAGSDYGFLPFWTDTRTGIQEIFCGRRMSIGPWVGVQFRGRVAAHATHRWFTFGWPACWQVVWTVVPLTVRSGTPQIRWRVQVERATSGEITYWISITNLVDSDVEIEARYAVLAAD
jgi:hypothetical protein